MLMRDHIVVAAEVSTMETNQWEKVLLFPAVIKAEV